MRWIIAALLGSLVAGLAYSRRTLTLGGAAAAAGVGTIVFARGGLRGSAALLAFFVSSSALSRVGRARKQGAQLAQVKGPQRDAWQVLANGGFATASIALGHRNAFVGALAAAGADTWATELGMLSSSPPRLITSFETVPAGTSGGVTLVGLSASAGGALAVGLAAGAPRTALVAGVAGSILDSILGATIQAAFVCEQCGAATEEPRHVACDAAARQVKGVAWVNNDTVNAAATLAGAAVGALV